MGVTVTEIIEEVAKHGISAKTGKDWSMAKVKLSTGQEAWIFNPIAVGDKVTSVKNGDYENWTKVKPDPKHDEIMTALRLIMAEVKKLNSTQLDLRDPFTETGIYPDEPN